MSFSLSRLIQGAAFLVATGWCLAGHAQNPYQSTSDFEKYARMLREKALLELNPVVVIPTINRSLNRPRYPWKNNIVTTTFWVGESAGRKNPGSSYASSWDLNWSSNFGGFDNPTRRSGFLPAGFIPKLNPFYVALPYNDVARETTKPEARVAIPWFKDEFMKEGQSVCRDRWVRIRNRAGRDCYAQWSDCGPHRTDHWQYVFGDERPKPNANQGAGLSISPAVRDFLELNGTDVTDWQFVDFRDVPRGPWSLYGENNGFVKNARTPVGLAPLSDSATPEVPGIFRQPTSTPVINLK